MTDSVFITGAENGALASAFAGLPPWASDQTAKDIEKILKDSLKIQTTALSQLVKSANANGTGLSTKTLKKLDTELGGILKNLVDENKEFKKTRKQWGEEERQNKINNSQWKKQTAQSGISIVAADLLIRASANIKDAFIQNVDTFDMLYKSGINVVAGLDSATSGFDALQQLTALTGVRYTELAKTMTKFSTSVSMFGAGKFAKTMGAASLDLRKFGFTAQETGDLLGYYLESQRGYTNVNSKSQDAVQSDLVKFGERISKLSLATGMAREKLLENVVALSHSVEANILSGQVGNDASQSTLEFIASMKDQKLGKDMLKMMTDSIKPLNAVFMSLQKSGGGAFAQKEMAFMQSLQGIDDPEEKKKRLAEFQQQNDAEIKMMIQRNNLLAQAGSQDAAAANEHLVALQQEGKAYRAISAEERKKLALTAEATKTIKSAWERFQSAFQLLFAPMTKILDALSWVLEVVNTVVTKIYENVNGTLLSIVGFGLVIAAAVSAMKLFTGGLSGLFRNLSGGRGGGPSGGAGGGAGGAGGASIGGGIGKGLEGLGKGIAAIGTGTGKAIGGILKGIASGLHALSNPKLLIGTVVLAALSGSIWLAGKAFQSFQDLDWGSIGKAVLGIAAVGLAAAALGIPVVAAAVGLGALVITGLAASIWLLGTALKGFPTEMFSGLGGMFAGFGEEVGKLLTSIVKPFTQAFEFISNILGEMFGVISHVYKGVGDMIKSVVDVIVAPFKFIGKMVTGVFKTVYDVISNVFSGVGSLATSVVDVIVAPFKFIGSILGSIFNVAKTIFGGMASAVDTVATAYIGAFKWVGSVIGKVFEGIGNTISTLMSPVKWLVDKVSGLFSGGGPESAAKQLTGLSDSAQGLTPYAQTLEVINQHLTLMSSTLASFTGIDTLKSIVGTINSIDTIKAVALGALSSIGAPLPNVQSTTGVSVPAAPPPSTIDSPSAKTTKADNTAPAANTPSTPVGPGLEKPPANADITNMMAFQGSVLEQILLSTNSLLSVNKDILRYTKSQT